jgi:SAM-dependent methyltransferase
VAHHFDHEHWAMLEDPERFVELPPSVIVDLLALHGDETIADFGAGTGMYSLPLAAAVPRGRLYAIESSPELLQRLAAKLDGDPPGADQLTAVHTDGERIPLPDGVVEAAVMINVVHHVWDQPRTLADLVRILRPGGRLVVFEFGDIERPVGPDRGHVLPHDQLRALVTGLGLSEVAVYEPGTLVSYHIAIVAEKPGPEAAA